MAGLLIGCLLLAAPARGRAADDASPAETLARSHYQLGKNYYNVSNYEKAVVEFEEAYKLVPKPDLLYNIARCHEAMGNFKQAISNYKLYLEKKPNFTDRATLELKIQNLERLQQEKDAGTTKPPIKNVPGPKPPARATVVTAPPAAVEPPPVRPEAPGHTWKWTAGWAGVGVGGALLVTGIILGAKVSSKVSEYNDAAGPNGGGTYSDLNAISSSGSGLEKGQFATLILGGLTAAAGGGLLIWELLGTKERPATGAIIAPFATANGAGMVGAARF